MNVKIRHVSTMEHVSILWGRTNVTALMAGKTNNVKQV